MGRAKIEIQKGNLEVKRWYGKGNDHIRVKMGTGHCNIGVMEGGGTVVGNGQLRY